MEDVGLCVGKGAADSKALEVKDKQPEGALLRI
jgi:hypothetical protein